MKSINGNMNAVESADIIPTPTDAEGYLAAASSMLDGVRILVAASPIPAIAISFLCGHASEVALKAMLSHAGVSTDDLIKTYGHNLTELWQCAVSKGLPLQSSPPSWFGKFKNLHGNPYLLRYPLRLNGLVLPNLEAMVQDVEMLVSSSKSYIEL